MVIKDSRKASKMTISMILNITFILIKSNHALLNLPCALSQEATSRILLQLSVLFLDTICSYPYHHTQLQTFTNPSKGPQSRFWDQ